MIFRNSAEFLASVQGLYRMDRGDRIYAKRHFQRWLDAVKILEAMRHQNVLFRVLDVGCGSGFFMLMLGGKSTGLDNVENVKICRRRGLEAYAVDLETERFPSENETFDVAVCLEVLEHLRCPTNVLDEIHRLLKSDGCLLLSTPNSRMPTWRIRDFLFRFGLISQIYIGRNLGMDEKRYSKDELGDLLLLHGFEMQSVYCPRILLPGDDLLVVARKLRLAR